MIAFNCLHCGHKFRAADDLAGKFGKCKGCGTRIRVPDIQRAATVEPQREPEFDLSFLQPPHEAPDDEPEYDLSFLHQPSHSPECARNVLEEPLPSVLNEVAAKSESSPVVSRELLIARICDQMPFSMMLLGRLVVFQSYAGDQLKAVVGDMIDGKQFDYIFSRWDTRRPDSLSNNNIHARENREEMRYQLKQASTISSFLKMFVPLPIGIRLFIHDERRPFAHYERRIAAINEALLTWNGLFNSQRNSDGTLKLAIPCAAYRNRLTNEEREYFDLEDCLCRANVTHPTGCCSPHRKPGTKTLFDNYPFFAEEGFPELML